MNPPFEGWLAGLVEKHLESGRDFTNHILDGNTITITRAGIAISAPPLELDDAPVVSDRTDVLSTAATSDHDRSPEIGDVSPPKWAELLLTFFARASRDEFAAGDMREVFIRDCAERGRSLAGQRYWAEVLGYLLQRSLWLAALAGIIKKMFVG